MSKRRRVSVLCGACFLRFFFRFCDGGHQAAEEDGCGNAGGTGGDSAREHAENAFFFYGGFYTLTQIAPPITNALTYSM